MIADVYAWQLESVCAIWSVRVCSTYASLGHKCVCISVRLCVVGVQFGIRI